MSRILSMLIVTASFFCFSPLSGADMPQFDYEFNQDRMLVDRGEIFLISTFTTQDGVTVYNFNGQRLWEVRFHAKIMSWSVQSDVVLVFSKDRDGHATYLTCLDRRTGRCLWQRP